MLVSELAKVIRASRIGGVVEFNTGVGRDVSGAGATDTASLFAFEDTGARMRSRKWSSTLVSKFRLTDLLSLALLPMYIP